MVVKRQNNTKLHRGITGGRKGRTKLSIGTKVVPVCEPSQERLFSRVFESWDFVISSANYDRTIDKTRVGFDRTEVSIPSF